ncbi:hypothetical protein [Shewanella maritima]|uniref:hypothetical protein n=1 Tax=Shewanella maritima TaxID=2520507 RepID=UPI003736E4A0
MQIGCCWFDKQQMTLVDQTIDKAWALNHHEYWVLQQLTQRRGQVVSVNQLSMINVAGQDNQALTESHILHVVEELQSYLGNNHACLLEYIPKQGVILHSHGAPHKAKVLDEPNAVMSISQFILISVVIISALFYLSSNIKAPQHEPADLTAKIITEAGDIGRLDIYTGSENFSFLAGRKEDIIQEFSQCSSLYWDVITISISADWQTVSFVLKREVFGDWLFHNIKVLRDDKKSSFFSTHWLEEVNICG